MSEKELSPKRKYTRDFNQDEMKNISKNFSTICNSCSIYAADLHGILSPNVFNAIFNYYVSGYKTDPIYSARRSTIDKFISYFNEHYSPSISLIEMISDNFGNKTFSKKKDYRLLDWYAGQYYCYYFDSNEELCFGVLTISATDSMTRCEAIMDCDRSTFDISLLPKLDTAKKPIKPLIDINKEILCDNTIKEYQKNLCYFSGTIDIFTYSSLLTITPLNNSYVRNITFHRYDVFKNDKNTQCIGSIGTMIKSEHSTPCSVRKILFSRYKIDVDDKAVMEIIKKAFKFETISNTQVESKEDNNDMVYRLIRQFM